MNSNDFFHFAIDPSKAGKKCTDEDLTARLEESTEIIKSVYRSAFLPTALPTLILFFPPVNYRLMTK